MSKGEKTVILPSEEDGWEVWKSRDGVVTHERSIEGALSKADGQQDDCVAFSVVRVATMPLIVPSTDPEIYQGAAQLELENSGLLVDVENYQGWDCVVVEQGEEESFVSAIYLLEEELNAMNDLRQYSFDFSARFYRPTSEGDCIALWRERHRWCLACYRKGVPFLTEPLGEELVDLGSFISLTLAQLSLKGIEFQPTEVFLWSGYDGRDALANELVSANVVLSEQPRPVPSFPSSSIELQPSAVSEWQKQVSKMLRLRVIAGAVAALYVIVAAVLWWKMYGLDQQVTELRDEVTMYSPAWESNSEHFKAWDELYPLVTDNWPLVLYKDSVNAIPGGQPIRYTSINVQNGYVQIRGNARGNDFLNRYKPKLKNAPAFEDFAWTMQPAIRDPKTGLWKFTYEAKPEGLVEF